MSVSAAPHPSAHPSVHPSVVKREPSPAAAVASPTAQSASTAAGAGAASDEKYWLVRVPSFIMSEFKNLSQQRGPGARLGSIVIHRHTQPAPAPAPAPATNTTTNKQTQVKQEPSFPNMRLVVDSPDPNLPRECNLHVRPKKRSMLVFSDSGSGSGPGSGSAAAAGSAFGGAGASPSPGGDVDRCRLHAEIELVADANPVDGQIYRNWLAKRLERATTKTHVTKGLDDSQQSVRLLPHAVHAQQPLAKKARVEAPRERRVAAHASQVEDLLYRAFDKKPYWTLKDLLKETNQPKPALLNVLNELCDRESKGDLIHHFALKPQFRLSADRPTPMTT